MTIIRDGGYLAADGSRIELAAEVAAAVAGTRLFTPEQLARLLDVPGGAGARPCLRGH
jgi:hypothetical protein